MSEEWKATFPIGKPRWLTPEEVAESDRLREIEHRAEVERLGHDHDDIDCPTHSFARTPDCPPYVECALCGETLQVG